MLLFSLFSFRKHDNKSTRNGVHSLESCLTALNPVFLGRLGHFPLIQRCSSSCNSHENGIQFGMSPRDRCQGSQIEIKEEREICVFRSNLLFRNRNFLPLL